MRCAPSIVMLGLLVCSSSAADEPDWVSPMRKVHAGWQGTKSTLIHLGDSITYSMAYFTPLCYAADAKMSPDTRAALDRVNGYMNQDCYRWKGGEAGNYSGQTAAWGLKNIDTWIDKLQPEVALVMFGTNDIRRGSVEDHAANLRGLIQKCLDRGVVVILSTIPPMHGQDDKVRQAVEKQRKIAEELHVPLIDFYAHVLNRRPNDWDGAAKEFADFSQWEVPTIISQDGVHPSNPAAWRKDYTEQGLCRNGNILRSYLTLRAYAEVIEVVIQGRPPTDVSRTILGANPPKPAELPKIEIDTNGIAPEPSLPLPVQAWFPKAPPLPLPSGPVVRVKTVAELYAAAQHVPPGGTILLAEGRYRMPETLHLQTNEIALRGETGNREKVVLDFAHCQHHEGIAISRCSGVTIADLTVQNVRQNGIKINSNLDVDRVTLYNLISRNVWQRHVKGPGVPDRDGQPGFVEACRIQYCLFCNDRPKQQGDEPWEDSQSGSGFNYVGGIDVMNARGWTISDNVFTEIHGGTGEARGAVFLWHNSTDCVIERNIILDCDSGICLGNSSSRGTQRHANAILVRNNFVVRCPENNILADHTRDCSIVHNTVHDPESRFGRLLRVVHANDGLLAAYNIFSGPRIAVEAYEGQIEVRDNLIRSVSEYFVDANNGNLHLTNKAIDAIDRAMRDERVPDDIDGDRRTNRPDLGADEL